MAVAQLDAHSKPPSRIRDAYKHYQKLLLKDIDADENIIDTASLNSENRSDCIRTSPEILVSEARKHWGQLADGQPSQPSIPFITNPKIYQLCDLPGLYIYPNLFDVSTQRHLLDVLLHRDLSNPTHQTNVHMHYHMQYPSSNTEQTTRVSFFDESASNLTFQPIDTTIHKPFSLHQFLTKKLRWMTIGGQYDWTRKVYPDTDPPDFPHECKNLIESVFPLKAEAAIVNLYSPGDTLSLHRDVSELCDCPLASVSIGCDALFTVGLETETDCKVATIRLRSGDAVLMSGPSRYAWHGVPRVLAGTCPEELSDWPCQANDEVDGRYEAWRGWLGSKRINLNVRQMKA